MWKSRLPWARFPRDSWKEGEAALGFPRFPQAQLFFALFFGSTPAACSFAFALAFRLLILLGMLHPIARDV